jgi:AcrR family transcriptional regulator
VPDWPSSEGAAADVVVSLNEALLTLALSHGVENLTPRLLSNHLEMDSTAIDRNFGSVEECCERLFESIWNSLASEVGRSVDSADSWLQQLRAAAHAVVRWIQDNSRAARFAAVEMLNGGEWAQVMREQRLEPAVDFIDRGRECLADPDALSRDVAIAIVGGIEGVLVKELCRYRAAQTVEGLVGDLMYIAVRPYLGDQAARDELAMTSPAELIPTSV